MEGKIALFNADGTQIGDTFARRARQLVKQQRATWVDDNHTAIRFNPDPADTDSWEEALPPYPTPATLAVDRPKRGPLYAMAEERLRERRRVIKHLLLFIPLFIGILFFTVIINDGWHGEPAFLFFGFTNGVLVTFNVCNIRAYLKMYGLGTFSYLKTRREIQLAEEVEKLRRMGYDE